MANKRKSLCIDEKVLLIRAIDAGERISNVSKRFGFSRSTVATIWKNKEKILQAEEDGKSCKKLKKPKYENLDQALAMWFHLQRQNNMPTTGPIVKAMAEKYAEEFGLTSFKASEGWLGKFKQRHNINSKNSGETFRNVGINITHDWINAGLCTNSIIDEVKTEPDFDMAEKFTENLQTYIEVGNCLRTSMVPLADKEIVDFERKTMDQEKLDEQNETDELEPPPSNKEALEAANLLEKYFLYHQDHAKSQDMNEICTKIQQNYWCSKRIRKK